MKRTRYADLSSVTNQKHTKPPLPTTIPNEIDDDTVYTKDYLIHVINELAEEFPDKRITRDFFRKNGGVPERYWAGHFGSFPEFLKAAGLERTRYQGRLQNRIAQHASVDGLRELDGQRKQYANLYPKETGSRWKTLIAGSDFHDHEIDPFFRRVFTETVRTVQPDVVCLDGDIFDCPEFGKYTVDPREWDVVGRINFGLDIIKDLREAAPDSQIDLLEGNHEARILKHLSECSPALRAVLSDLHQMDMRKLFKLDQYEVNYVAKGDLFTFTDAQLRKEVQKNYKVYWDCLMADHFPTGRKNGLPGFNGHHHKHMVWSEYNATYGSYEWIQMGAGHLRDATYCAGEKWNNGFLIAHVDTLYKFVNFEYVSVGTTMAVAAGNFFYRSEEEMYPAIQWELNSKARK